MRSYCKWLRLVAIVIVLMGGYLVICCNYGEPVRVEY